MFRKENLNYAPIPLPHRSKMSDEEMRVAAEGFLAKMSRRHTVRDYARSARKGRQVANMAKLASQDENLFESRRGSR